MVEDEPPPAVAVRNNIGKTAGAVESRANIDGLSLESQEKLVLQKIKSVIGPKQVTIGALAFAPGWLIDDAISKGLQSNWQDAYTPLLAHLVSSNPNVIGSHFISNIKEDGNGKLKLKARIVLHRKRNRDRYNVRRDSASADLLIVRLVTSLSTVLGFTLVSADVKDACMQSDPIQRELSVRPPGRLQGKSIKICKINSLPYGMVEAGRQWLCVIKPWLLQRCGANQVSGVDQLFNKKGVIIESSFSLPKS